MDAALPMEPSRSPSGQWLRANFQLSALAYAMRTLSLAACQVRSFKLDLVVIQVLGLVRAKVFFLLLSGFQMEISWVCCSLPGCYYSPQTRPLHYKWFVIGQSQFMASNHVILPCKYDLLTIMLSGLASVKDLHSAILFTNAYWLNVQHQTVVNF